MADAPLDRLNALTILFDAMLNLRTEMSVDEFDDFQSEIHASVSRLKKAGLWLRQIMPLILPSIRVLQRMEVLAVELEQRFQSNEPHGFRRLSRESSALLKLVDAYESGETILFSDEMNLVTKEPSTSSTSSNGF